MICIAGGCRICIAGVDVLIMKSLKWKVDSICLEIVLILMQDRSTVCMEHTIC